MQDAVAGWDEVQLFLVLVRARTLFAAAKLMGVSPSTLSRRLASLEKRSGVRLFERTRDGLVPTAATERLLAPAQATEASISRFFAELHPVEREVEETVRVSAPPGMVEIVILPAAGVLLGAHPKLRLEVDSSEAIASLVRREADVVVRMSRPSGEGLVIRRVGSSPTGIFVSPQLGAAVGKVTSLEDLPWVTWDRAHAGAATARWLDANVKVASAVRASTVLAQVAAAECSLGAALLPVVIASRRALVPLGLGKRLAATLTFPSDDVYLACHAALRQLPRIRTVWSFLLTTLRSSAPAPS